MNKRFLLLIFAGCMLSNTQNRAMERLDNPLAKTVLGFLGLGAIGWLSNKAFSSPQAHRLCNWMGISPFGAKQITFLSTSALSLSYLSKGSPEVSEQFFRLGWKSPLIGLTNVLVNKPAFREMVATAPLIGEYLSCPFATQANVDKTNDEMAQAGIDTKVKKCVDGCRHCKSIDAIRLHILWTALLPEATTLVRSFIGR